jgi:hypothetical protein
MKDVLQREFAKQTAAKTPAPAKALSQAQVAGKQLAEQIIAQATIAAQAKVKAVLAQVKAATAPKLSTLDAKMMALLTGSTKSSSVDNRMVALAADEAKRISR